MIDLFKEIYGGSAFLCRFSHCSKISEGFASKKEREKHEILHTKRFKCAESTCEFYIRGFPSKGALQKHNRTYHTKSSDNIPEFLQPRTQHPSTGAPNITEPESLQDELAKESFLITPDYINSTVNWRFNFVDCDRRRVLELWETLIKLKPYKNRLNPIY